MRIERRNGVEVQSRYQDTNSSCSKAPSFLKTSTIVAQVDYRNFSPFTWRLLTSNKVDDLLSGRLSSYLQFQMERMEWSAIGCEEGELPNALNDHAVTFSHISSTSLYIYFVLTVHDLNHLFCQAV